MKLIMKLIHDGNNPGFFFPHTEERFEYLAEEGCAPHLVTPEKAQEIWDVLGFDGEFPVYLGDGVSVSYTEYCNG